MSMQDYERNMSEKEEKKAMEEEVLLDKYDKLGRKIENSVSDSEIEKAQIERKRIRDKLVEEYGWSRKEANELCE